MSRGCESFVYCDIDGCQFCVGEALEVQKVEGAVDDGDVHGDSDFCGFGGAGGGDEFCGGVAELGGDVDEWEGLFG